MQERFFSPGMQPGIGVNLLDGSALELGVTGTLTPPDAAGQQIQSRIIRVEDITSLHTSLGVDVSASGSYMGFSASDKMSYADTCGFDEHSIFLLVSVVVTNALTRMNTPALTPEAALLLQNGKPDRFRQRFGDVFVAGVHTGGEYFAIFQIIGTDETEKESLSNTVTASYTTIGAGVDLSNTVTKAKQSSHSHLDLRTFTFQNGGADTTVDQDPTQIINKAHSFASSLTGANSHFAVPYAILPESYLTLDLPGDNANLIDIENQKEMLAKNFSIRNQLMLLINNIDYILLSQAQNHNEFEPFDSDALTADRNRLAAELDKITSEASKCMQDAKLCHLASFEVPAKPLPKKLPTVPSSLVVPKFIGLHPGEADALSIKSGVLTVEGQPSGPDDTFDTTSLQLLQLGDGGGADGKHPFNHPHSNDQIVVSDQRPREGSFLSPGSSVELGYGLMPGVPN